MSETTIQWTEKTWNPVTGCNKISPGCKHCYAETIAERFWAKQYEPNADGTPRKFTDVRWHDDRLEQPLRWRKPSRIFVNSMSDLFHEDVPFEFIQHVFYVMGRCPQHTFQILTKRAQRMLEFTQWLAGEDHISIAEWPRNVWLGVSVENQKYADERIPILLNTPAAIRWISVEPLLGPVDLDRRELLCATWRRGVTIGTYLDWVVVGGESGAGARPMELQWARDIQRQCRDSKTAFFMKQLGGVRDSRGEMSDFPPDLQVREYPA